EERVRQPQRGRAGQEDHDEEEIEPSGANHDGGKEILATPVSRGRRRASTGHGVQRSRAIAEIVGSMRAAGGHRRPYAPPMYILTVILFDKALISAKGAGMHDAE